MALLRKIVQIGNSKAIVIPKQYFEFYKLQGKEIKQVGLEIGEKLTIEPIFTEISEQGKKEKSVGVGR
jgi:antitoxin component of MazEF toxin-antitoxin module